ncbi:MAG: hypothetical protein AAF614_17035 [Chloroflexota bacterium]
MTDSTGLIIGFILTLFIYSYLVGDNPLFRLASYILVGVSAAYAAVVVSQQVLWPIYEQLRAAPTERASLLWLVPIVLALLLALKRLPAFSWLGSMTLALLIGVGAAVALTGALLGTLWPQVTAAGNGATPLRGLLIALLTISTLLSFQYVRRANEKGEAETPRWLTAVSTVGQAVLMVTFGAIFANVLNTGLVLLAERVTLFLN